MDTKLGALLVLVVIGLHSVVGCTRVSGITRKNYEQIAISAPNILIEDKIDTSKTIPIGEYYNYKADILSLLRKNLARQDIAKGAPFTVANMSIGILEDYSPATVHILAALSTVLPIPTSFFRTKNDISWNARYSIVDSSGNVVYDRKLAGDVAGYYMGWSFVRYAKRSSLRNEQGKLVSVSIANAIANDIVLNFPTILEHLSSAKN